MKKFAIALIVLFGLVSLAWGEPPVRQVEVVNDLFVNIQDQPVDVNVIDQSHEYEYKVFRLESVQADEAMQNFQAELNANAIEGWELVSFSHVYTPWSVNKVIYVGVMKRVRQ